ncbi:MAG TPA: DUF192 domain-containing protein [Steroidobacteraceae bacterium]|nr:DUF192 domain-containing protein [Steroidobacteraceae bacterium]
MNVRIDQTRIWLATLILAGTALLLHGVAGRAQTPTPPLEELSAFPQTTLTVSGSAGSHQFTVWVANTAAREEQGLMFVRELPANQGMVFSEPEPKVWTMWMKNTYVPLDMLFVDLDGHVVKIAHAIPHDETTISSEVPVHGIIELQGGISDMLHIKVGDLAKWKSVP